ncbi:MAG: hypothetical protein K2L49_09065 [Muribaculaceae bacterium]|nr:hypothetical protein [Muribaculaceae bacterium]
MPLILGVSLMLLMTSCGSRQNADQSTETAYETDSEEDENGDADGWHYRVLLKTKKPLPGEEHLYDGAPEFAGLSLQNAAGDFWAFDDEVDYAQFARPLLFAYKLAERADFSTPKEWNKFAVNVLDKTIYITYSASCLDYITDSQWREKAKKLWYDAYREKPIEYGNRSYGKQTVRYDKWDSLMFVRVNAENEFDLPEGAILITTGWY